jgi:hypothetical protein
MKSNIFHNNKLFGKNSVTSEFTLNKNTIQTSKRVVDINKILNRVRVENKSNKIKNIKFYILTLTFLCSSVIFIFH